MKDSRAWLSHRARRAPWKLHTWKLLLGSWFTASWGPPSFGKFWTGLCRNGNHPTWCLRRKHIKFILVNRVRCTQEFKGPLDEMRSPSFPSSHQNRTWLEACNQTHLQTHSSRPGGMWGAWWSLWKPCLIHHRVPSSIKSTWHTVCARYILAHLN